MRIPYSIPRHVFEAYRCSYETTRLDTERDRTIRAEDEFWDEKKIASLKILALRVIASSWKDNPILEELPTCEDRDMLMALLPIDLPFELIITKIEDEQYWERSSRNRWEHNNVGEHGGSWRRRYCEGHFREYLENLEPSYFESQQEECEKTIQLVRNYVHTLELRSLRPTKKQSRLLEEDEDPCAIEKDVVHHIPFLFILPKLAHLSELRINFGVIYMDDGFQWRDFEFSVQDCLDLGKAIELCSKLNKFALTRSNLDQPRAAALLQGMVKNDHIEEIDFSHCKLKDNGSHAVGEFLRMHKGLKVIRLANNDIGPNGVSGMMYGLIKSDHSKLSHLNLKLNPLLDDGVARICSYLLRTDSLKVLNLSACGITADGGTALAEVLSSGCVKFETFSLDISNNDLGETVGEAFAAAANATSFIVSLSVRMCNFSNESELSIYESVLRNRRNKKKEQERRMILEQMGKHATNSTVSIYV